MKFQSLFKQDSAAKMINQKKTVFKIILILLIILLYSQILITLVKILMPKQAQESYPEPSFQEWTKIWMKTNNTKLLFILRPNTSVKFDGFEVKLDDVTEITINARGWRDYEYNITKPNNTYRIIAVGDSYTLGPGVELDNTYAKVLEKMLSQLNSTFKYEVLNFGIIGYDTTSTVELIKTKVLEYEPDVIIIGIGLLYYQVWYEQYFKNSNLTFNPSNIKKLTEQQIKNLIIPEWLKQKIMILRNETKNLCNAAENVEPEEEEFCLKENFQKPINELYKIIDTNKTRIIFIDFKNVESLQKYVHNKTITIQYQEYYQRKKYEEKDIKLHLEDVHPNRMGHKLIAQAVYETLVNKKIILT